ncbi:MAG: uracil-DNA glycosylase [Eubacteriales bacterium]
MKIPQDWYGLLQEEYDKPYYRQLMDIINEEYKSHRIYPPQDQIYRALELTPFHKVKVVILGQDPYHNKGQAQGLAFSVAQGVPIPKSLRNIYKEIEDDVGCTIPTHGNLEAWAMQGVLLLNTVLTVREHTPESHKKFGWEQLTDEIICQLNNKEKAVVFLLWGAHARKKVQLITNPNHFVIESAHPSPLSARRGFFGSKPFSRTNAYLQSKGRKTIDWQIYD